MRVRLIFFVELRENERGDRDPVEREMEHVLGIWGSISGSGYDPIESLEWGSHEFNNGDDELRRSISMGLRNPKSETPKTLK